MAGSLWRACERAPEGAAALARHCKGVFLHGQWHCDALPVGPPAAMRTWLLVFFSGLPMCICLGECGKATTWLLTQVTMTDALPLAHVPFTSCLPEADIAYAIKNEN